METPGFWNELVQRAFPNAGVGVTKCILIDSGWREAVFRDYYSMATASGEGIGIKEMFKHGTGSM